MTRFGLAFRSGVTTTIDGMSTLQGPILPLVGVASGQTSFGNFNTRIKLPATTVLSAYQDLNPQWAIDGSLYYTQWSSLSNTQVLNNVAGLSATVPVTVSLPQNYRNTWLIALSGIYHCNQDWLFRAGINFDESPVKSSERNIALPDSNRVAVAVGAHYQAAKQVGFDFGYKHLFFQNANVSVPIVQGTQISTANGSFKNSANEFAGQITFDLV